MKKTCLTFILAFFIFSCTDEKAGKQPSANHPQAATPIINYAVTNTYPHDTTAFTEGLVVHKGLLYESTGSPDDMPQTRSLFGDLNLATGIINTKVELDRKKYFGEGICFLNDKVYQLTYRNKKGFIYDAKTFKKSGEFAFASSEGWGLTTDSTHLIMSDGTDKITSMEATNFSVVKQISVTDEKGPVTKINELEYINHFLYANVYGTSTILKIDPSTGKVVAKLELAALSLEAATRYRPAMEMNGIAYDPALDLTYVTGKMWPVIYEIRFRH